MTTGREHRDVEAMSGRVPTARLALAYSATTG